MKKILLILACLLLAIVAWVFPYIDELRDQGLTVEPHMVIFLADQITLLIPMMQLHNLIIQKKVLGRLFLR